MSMPPSVLLPAGWSLEHSRTHDRPYYYHKATGKVTWELPEILPSSSSQARPCMEISSTVSRKVPNYTEALSRSLSSPSQFVKLGDFQVSCSSKQSHHDSTSDCVKMDEAITPVERDCSSVSSECCSVGGSCIAVAQPQAKNTTSMAKAVRDARLKELESSIAVNRLRAHNYLALARPLYNNSGTQTDMVNSLRCSDGVEQIDAIENVRQLIEESKRSQNAAGRAGELTALVSNLEVERWGLEAALVHEEQSRIVLENQARCLEVDLIAKTSDIQIAQQGLREREAQLHLLKTEVEKSYLSAPTLGPHVLEWCRLQSQLSSTEELLQKREAREVFLYAEIAKCEAATQDKRSNILSPSARSAK